MADSTARSRFHYGQPRLENRAVTLQPFDPNVHVNSFVQAATNTPQSFNYVALPPAQTNEQFIEWYGKAHSVAENCLYAIHHNDSSQHDPEPSASYAGVLSIFGASVENAAAEMGVLVFPTFRDKLIATNAVGVALLWLLDPPSAGGLGLRRVVWEAHVENMTSRRLALRVGFELEGIKRWARVVKDEEVSVSAEALARRNGTATELPGRHTAVYSIVWDEWDAKRPRLISQLEGNTVAT
ncbi:hypothetical protein QQS21_012266 [Conoideocrella luteorostrata]|uniref:N-acetyltransferase domain-containing protein n=1 Tax=Conoideocrella luteorostrata TaxID=1105319 RepID=A0AAJ0CEC9_9HYPO|nr:hypothetical protein QQS21_012266 [Conoideocrella luteorostrata]